MAYVFVETLVSEFDYSLDELREEELYYTPDFELEEDNAEDSYDFLVEDTEDT